MENTNINPLAENAFLQQRLGLDVIYAQEETGASACVCVCARAVCVRAYVCAHMRVGKTC